jgi:hypothetical protein
LGNEIRKKEEQAHKLKGTGMAKNQLEVISASYLGLYQRDQRKEGQIYP